MLNMMRGIYVGMVALALGSASAVAGVVVERTVQLDLAALALPTADLNVQLSVDMFTVDVGDTLVFHLQFAGGRLGFKDSTASNPDYVGLSFMSNPPNQTGFLFTGNWDFEDVDGDLLVNDISFLYGGPIGGFTANTNLTDSAFSISGITYTVHVTFKEPGRPPFTADGVGFRAYVGGFPDGSISVQAIPEPAAVALVGAALVGLAATRRRRPALPT
jgi:hypothetical protein